MTIDNNKTQNPEAADRAYVAGLIQDLGMSHAAKKLGLSRLATLNLASGGPTYSKSRLAVKAARKKAA